MRVTHLRTTHFGSSLKHKKALCQEKKRKPFRRGLVAISRQDVVLKSMSLASQLLPISTRNQPWVALPETSPSARGDVPNVFHEQALSNEPEHRPSELEKCDSWFSIRNYGYPPTHHSKCITFRKKMANLWDAPWARKETSLHEEREILLYQASRRQRNFELQTTQSDCLLLKILTCSKFWNFQYTAWRWVLATFPVRPLLLFSLFLVARAPSFFRKHKKKILSKSTKLKLLPARARSPWSHSPLLAMQLVAWHDDWKPQSRRESRELHL